jgi:hypothetical protein
MYPEVHTLADGNLRWSAMEAQGSPNAMESHYILLEPSRQDGRPNPLYMGPLMAVTKPIQSLGQFPQLNWRLSRKPQSHKD